jgi:hypothetical protein
LRFLEQAPQTPLNLAGQAHDLIEIVQGERRNPAQQVEEDLTGYIRVAQRAVSFIVMNTQGCRERAKAVRWRARHQQRCQFKRIECWLGQSHPLSAQHTQVELDIVPDERVILEERGKTWRNFGKARGAGEHICSDACQPAGVEGQ